MVLTIVLQASGDEHEDRHKLPVPLAHFLHKMGKRAGGNGPWSSWTMVIAEDLVHLKLSSPARMQVRVDRDNASHSEQGLFEVKSCLECTRSCSHPYVLTGDFENCLQLMYLTFFNQFIKDKLLSDHAFPHKFPPIYC